MKENISLKTCGPQIRLCFFPFYTLRGKQTTIDTLVDSVSEGSASDWGARSSGLDLRLWQGFLCCILFVVVVFVFLRFGQKHIICTDIL